MQVSGPPLSPPWPRKPKGTLMVSPETHESVFGYKSEFTLQYTIAWPAKLGWLGFGLLSKRSRRPF